MPDTREEIYEGCTVVVKRGHYLKTCRIMSGRSYTFGKRGEGQFTLNLDGAVGCMFGTTFRMEKLNKKLFAIHKVDDASKSLDMVTEGGEDNRDLQDDGQSQKLTPEQISQLKHQGLSGKEVIQKITENSATFKDKTVYSQEKYISKKQKKYEERLTIHRPSIRLINAMYYIQDPLKIANLRQDSLAQLLSHSNVQAGGRFIVFEAGTQGLVTAAMLHRMGTTGRLVQVYHGGHPQREAVDMMNFTQAELKVLSFLSHHRLPDIIREETTDVKMEDNTCDEGKEAVVVSGDENNSSSTSGEGERENPTVVDENQDKDKQQQPPRPPRKFVRTQVEDISMSTQVLSGGVEGVVVVCKHYPNLITKELLHFLKPGHPFVVFSTYKEPLMELFTEIKTMGGTNLRLSETWLRHYQVLSQRTHPTINMSGGGGYLLVGTWVARPLK